MASIFDFFTGGQSFGAGYSEPELAQGRQTMFNQLAPEQQASVMGPNTPAAYQMQQRSAFDQLTNPQQDWMGGANATDPYIRARMPQVMPTQSKPVEQESAMQIVNPELKKDVLDPKDVNYKSGEGSSGRSGGGGIPSVSAPSLGGIGGGSAGGGGTQYAGGIPVILRSYGEPSAGLLKYIEG